MAKLPEANAFGYMPRTEVASKLARERGWWVSAVEHASDGKVGVTYVFRSGRSRKVWLLPQNWSAEAISVVGETFLTDDLLLRR